MILGDKELAWQHKVIREATAQRWTVYPAASHNQKPGLPSLILLRGRTALAVFLRTRTGRNRSPDVAAFTELTGVQAVMWSPDQWANIQLRLRGIAP